VVRLFFLDTLARFQVGVGIPVSAEDIILQTFDNDDRKLQVCVCMLWKSNRKKCILKTDFYNVCVTQIQHAWILLSLYHTIPHNNYVLFSIILFFYFVLTTMFFQPKCMRELVGWHVTILYYNDIILFKFYYTHNINIILYLYTGSTKMLDSTGGDYVK